MFINISPWANFAIQINAKTTKSLIEDIGLSAAMA